MESEVVAPFDVSNNDVCPEGWRLYEGKLMEGDPCPVLSYMGNLYVPKSRQPKKWRGTVLKLAEEMEVPVWIWGDDVIVEVTEVRE